MSVLVEVYDSPPHPRTSPARVEAGYYIRTTDAGDLRVENDRGVTLVAYAAGHWANARVEENR